MRYPFSLQGFPFSKAIQGYLKCQNCGTSLRIAGFGKQVWFLFTVAVIAMVIYVFSNRTFFSIIGFSATVIYLILLIMLFGYVFIYGTWRHAILKKIDADATSKTDASV
jgi:membrane protein YdbS with pleckstrin-like domain